MRAYSRYTSRINISSKISWPGLAVLIIAAIALTFGRAVYFDFAPIDDYALIVYNLAIRNPSWASVHWIFTHFDPELYIPLTYVSFLGEYLAWGLRPAMFHLDSLVLHGVNALLVAALVGKLSSSRWIGAGAGLLFAVHPLQTEAVVWIAARKDLLMTFWGLITVLLVLRSEEKGQWRWLWIGFGTFVLALLSKVSIAALPLALVALMRMQYVSWKCVARRMAPFFAASAAFVVVALVGKADVLSALDPLHRLLLASYGIAAVIGRMLVPVHLTPFFVPPAIASTTVTTALVPPVLLIAAWFVRHRSPLTALGIVWMIALLLLPALNAQTDVNAAGATFAADRYGYLPMVGMLFVLVAVARLFPHNTARRIIAAVLAAAVSLGIVAARAQTKRWASAPTLYQYALDVEPASVDARIAIAKILRAQGRLEDAFAVLLAGLRYADTKALHLEAGSIYAATGRVGEAREQFTIARDRDPSAPEPYFALGELARQTGDGAGAEAFYDQAIEREPEYGDALARKAALLRVRGDDAGAEKLLQDILAFDPAHRDALVMMIALLRARGEDASMYVGRVQLLYPETP